MTEINEAINSRAGVLAKWYHFLEYDDMVQEGQLLVLKLQNKYGPDINTSFILKALNNHYSNIVDKAKVRNHREILFSCLQTEDGGDFMELLQSPDEQKILEEEDREDTLSHLSDEETKMVGMLYEGYSLDEIGGSLGQKKDTIKTKLRKVARR